MLAASAHAQPTLRFAPDRLIVGFAEAPPVAADGEALVWADEALEALATDARVTAVRPLFPARPLAGRAAHTDRAARLADVRAAQGLDGIVVLDLAAPADIEALAARWAAHPSVRFAEPDFVGHAAAATGDGAPLAGHPDARLVDLPNDPHFNRQWGHLNTGSHPGVPSPTAGAHINAPGAWALSTGSDQIIVAIVDSGLRLGHPDIAARVWTNPAETPNGLDDDGNGLVDDVYGWDWVNNDNDPTDDSGHGSNIAGLVGAIADNGIGVAGVDHAARLMILKAFAANLSGFYSWWISAVTYAVDHGAHVVNLSAGGEQPSAALTAAAAYARAADVLFTAPMMNFNNAVPYYPAAIPTVVAVGATNQRDERAAPFCWGGGSNIGPHIELSAPGDYMYGLTHNSDTNYFSYWCGSSMSAPYVAATASLMLARNPALTVEQILATLRSSAVDQVGRPTEDTPGFDIHHGHGRLDAAAALAAMPVADAAAPEAERLALTLAPNPASGTVALTLVATVGEAVRVGVYDVLGREVARVHDGPWATGARTLTVDASRFAPGLYVVRATAGRAVATQRLTVAR